MAKNIVLHDGDKLSLPVPEGTVSGDPVKVGGIIGVAVTNRGEGGNPETHASVWRHGAWDLTVAGAITETGQPVYITSSNGLTATEGENALYGYALATKTGAAAVIPVALAKV